MDSDRSPRQRGLSVSVLICILIPVFLLCIGLAVDGAAKAGANRRAQILAAQAARAGLDAAVPGLVSGSMSEYQANQYAVQVATRIIEQTPDIEGEARITPTGHLEVTTSTRVPALFLAVIRVDELAGTGSAKADIRMS